MKILHLYAGNLFGGIERSLLALWKYGGTLRMDFALAFNGMLASMLRDAGAPVEIVGPARMSRPWSVAAARKRLRQLLLRESYDLAITHSLWPHGVFAAVVREAGLPLVCWVHDVPRVGGWLERWATRFMPDLVLANSRFTASRVAALFPPAPCNVQHPIVDLIDCPSRSTVERLIILQASRLQPGKGHRVLLDALSNLGVQREWECWIAGGPQRRSEFEYLSSLHEQIETRGLTSRVRFLGAVNNIGGVLSRADVFCHPHVEPEGFGIALVEAMSAGVPVITSDLGAASEIVDPSCGRLVPPDDSAALANALRELMPDAPARRALGEAGAARARELFRADRLVEELQRKLHALREHSAATIS